MDGANILMELYRPRQKKSILMMMLCDIEYGLPMYKLPLTIIINNATWIDVNFVTIHAWDYYFSMAFPNPQQPKKNVYKKSSTLADIK